MKQIIHTTMVSIELIKMLLSEELQHKLDDIRSAAETDFLIANGDKQQEAEAAGEEAFRTAAAEMMNQELSHFTLEDILGLKKKAATLEVNTDTAEWLSNTMLWHGLDEADRHLNELSAKLDGFAKHQIPEIHQLALEAKQHAEKMGKLAVEVSGHSGSANESAMQAAKDLKEAEELVKRAENAVHTAEGSAKRAETSVAESFENSQKANDAAERSAKAAESVRRMRIFSLVMTVIAVIAIFYAAHVYYSKPTPGVSKEDVKQMIQDHLGQKHANTLPPGLLDSPRPGDKDKNQQLDQQQTPPPPADNNTDDEKRAEEKALKEIGG